MYSTLRFKPGWIVDDIMSDIVAVLTGETEVTNLSDSTRKEECEIVSTTAAGWLLHDQVSSSNIVLKAPIVDDPSTFKYIRIFATGNRILIKFYESWDEVNHTGLEFAGHVTNLYIAYESDTDLYQEVLISASARHFIATNIFNNLKLPISDIPFLSEHTRDSVWDTVANGISPWVAGVLNSSTVTEIRPAYKGNLYWPRTLNGFTGTEITNKLAPIRLPFGLSWNTQSDTSSSGSYIPSLLDLGWGLKMLDEDLNENFVLQNMGVAHPKIGHKGGDLSYFCNVHPWTANYGQSNDTVVFNGENYRIFTLTSHRLLVKEV